MAEETKPTEASIPSAKVPRLVGNLKTSAEDLLKLLEGETLEVEKVAEVTRFLARTARRIRRKAGLSNVPPPPGNEREREARSPKRPAGARPAGGGGRGGPPGRRGPGPRSGPGGGPRRSSGRPGGGGGYGGGTGGGGFSGGGGGDRQRGGGRWR